MGWRPARLLSRRVPDRAATVCGMRRIAVSMLAVGVLAGCAGGGADASPATAGSSSSPPQVLDWSGYTPSTTPAPPAAPLQASEVKVTLKTLSKKCFGSAGCNVEWRTDVSLARFPDAWYSVTYEVLGLEDEQNASFSVDPTGSVTGELVSSGSTDSSSAKLLAKVTDVRRIDP